MDHLYALYNVYLFYIFCSCVGYVAYDVFCIQIWHIAYYVFIPQTKQLRVT